ncbi:MAG: hypothetical protein K8R91_01645, partial [Phycisphaerae bacterium]|nr:hypothetical protein [Phycisphaerae bacterium]
MKHRIPIIALALLLTSCLTAETTTKPATQPETQPTAAMGTAALVREVRRSEQWVDQAKSLYIRMEGVWTRTPEGIAIQKAELKKQFPDATIDEQTFPDLRARSTEIVEIAFDAKRLATHRDHFGASDYRGVWNGSQYTSWRKSYTNGRESCLMDRKLDGSFTNNFLFVGWLSAGKHVSWWSSKEAKRENRHAAPEDFVLVGREKFRGEDCYVLMAPMPNSGNDLRWHISVANHRLRGLAKGWVRDRKRKLQLLAEIDLKEGKHSDAADELYKWLDYLPQKTKTVVRREFRLKSFAPIHPNEVL